MTENTDKAIEYFSNKGIEASTDDGSVYIKVDCDGGWIEVQISTAEVDYRADSYDKYEGATQ